MSRHGNCLDNPVVENFFGILKCECIYRQKIETYSQANQMIDDYISLALGGLFVLYVQTGAVHLWKKGVFCVILGI